MNYIEVKVEFEKCDGQENQMMCGDLIAACCGSLTTKKRQKQIT